MKNNHQVQLNDKQVEFLVKCIDITQETQSIKPDKSQMEVIRKLTNIQQKIDDDLQALNKFADSKSFFACKCGRKCSKYPIFVTFLTHLRAKIARKYLRAYLRARTTPEKHRKSSYRHLRPRRSQIFADLPPRFFDQIFPHRAL